MDDLVKLALQGLVGGGLIGITGVIFGVWDRRMSARKSESEQDRGKGQDALAERKAALEALLSSLQVSRQDAELARRDLAAERETNRAQTVRLAEKRQALAERDQLVALWEARGRAMDNIAHWLYHEANGLFMRMYAAGRRGIDIKAVGSLPTVPVLEDAPGWKPPPHTYATPEEIAATALVAPLLLSAPDADASTTD